MSRITIAGAGAFGTALAIALAEADRDSTLWARSPAEMDKERCNTRYLPEMKFPNNLRVDGGLDALKDAETVLLAVPTQNLRDFLSCFTEALEGKTCVLCCKGIEKGSGLLPGQVLAETVPSARIAVLTGPGFASEIARGLPTALTLATEIDTAGELQALLSTPSLRLYLSGDPTGAQLGGALKNVIAIACGVAIGAGLGESARASLLTRGYAEIRRLAIDLGAEAATLSGLSGLGDLALTCTSKQSRNYSLGLRLGRGGGVTEGTTFEGVATARACLTLAQRRGIDMPIAGIVAALLSKELTIDGAVAALLSRPLRTET
jgi:glycerol-3-phosphate dehydrogenase (NAD(P)+)